MTSGIAVGALLITTQFTYIPCVSRFLHGMPSIRVDAQGRIVKEFGGGYERKMFRRLAMILAKQPSRTEFLIHIQKEKVVIGFFDDDLPRQNQFCSEIKAATGMIWEPGRVTDTNNK
jgi:hypothetical protein